MQIKRLDEGPIIVHAMDGMLRGAYKESPQEFPDLKTFGATRSKYFAMLFTKNSPLCPILMSGVIKTYERGQYDRLSLSWQGSDIQSGSAVDVMVLSAGQVFLIFGLLLCLFSTSMFVLCC